MILPTRLSLALLLAVPLTLHAQDSTDLSARLQERIAASHATVGLYYRDLRSTDSIAINADARFHAASTMKVPVMIQVFRDADAGRLNLDDRLPVVNRFRSIADTSSYTLDRADDSDSSLYNHVGDRISIHDLVNLMITVSSNLATNILIDRVGATNVMATLHELGADSVTVLRGVEDNPAFRAGLNNTTTARGLGQVFSSIVDARAANATSCGTMVRILQDQHFHEGIPAGIPRGAKVAHKTGWITGLYHDGGIVYWQNRPRYVLVILTRGLDDANAAHQLVADLAGMVHAHAVPESLPKPKPAERTRRALPHSPNERP
jgi:beta-lactamase class A